MEAKMFVFKTALGEHEWDRLVDHYFETGMCLGLGRERETEKIRRAFTNSYRYVTAWEADIIIGAGRMISDGECYGWIHDMSVLASCRKQGIGRLIVEKLLEGNEGLLVGLTSSFEAVDFYTKLGFKKHKTAMAKYPRHSDYLHE
jgi:GNAT superfamily N-acetyltransferase